ncbi:MAG: nicotinate phosphoribosyltransferase [Candidatus Omnitrophica bacterium]|nr:nicotinate phosphoribosyltransferase [Candidatus Omnitrophota bacterium]
MIKPEDGHNDALKTDLYELTMAAGYFKNKMDARAVFELSCHTMPPNRSYLVACGLGQIADYVLNLRFNDSDIQFLKKVPAFKDVPGSFFGYLKKFRFTGDLWAMPEGEIFFAQQPIVQVEAPIIEAQILETYLLSIINIESLVASKAARVVGAARCDGKDRGVIDFGSRRAHGPQAGFLAARAAYIGGCLGTSNVYAGKIFGIPIFGTIAHSWVEAFDSEEESFSAYHKTFPENTILLVDTYDTIKAVKEITRMKLKNDLRGVRLDSGDLEVLSRQVRNILDGAGLKHVRIIASGNLNEYKIRELVKSQAPIDLFGVGTDMVTSRDYPALDLTYKLVQTESREKGITYKAKYSPGKETVPGRKQVFRGYTKKGAIVQDTVGLFSEKAPAGTKPLLRPVLRKGRLVEPMPPVDRIRKSAQQKLAQLPPEFLNLNNGCTHKVKYTPQISKLIK